MVSIVIFGLSNKNRNALKNEADKIFNFLRNVQAQATRLSPVITATNDGNRTLNRTLNVANFRPSNGFFEIRVLRVTLISNDPNFSVLATNTAFAEIDRKIQLNFRNLDNNTNVTINNNNYNFGAVVNNNSPISLFAVILLSNGRYAIGFRTDGNVALSNLERLGIVVSMRGVNRRHLIELRNNRARIQIYTR